MSDETLVRIGTRGSELALKQTRAFAATLRERHADLRIEEVILTSAGDRDQRTPLDRQGGVGLFTKELERALIEREIDIAVHSLKDLPTTLPDGLRLAAVPERESPWDAFVSQRYPDLIDMPDGARVATGSLRRAAQIRHYHPQLQVVGIRGNIDTRLAKYSELADALILAEAGLRRTGRAGAIRTTFGPTEMTPAPGQGALGIETRADDDALAERLLAVDDPVTRIAVTAERCFLADLEGGCHLPIAALGNVRAGMLVLTGMVATVDGTRLLQLSVEGDASDPRGIAVNLADKLRHAGGREIIASFANEAPLASGAGDEVEEPR